MISLISTSIMLASSPTVTNSVTFKIDFSWSAIFCSSRAFSLLSSLFFFLNLTELDFPLLVNLSRVSAIFFWILLQSENKYLHEEPVNHLNHPFQNRLLELPETDFSESISFSISLFRYKSE